MTVAELIERLQEMPQDVDVEIEIEDHGGWLDYYGPAIRYNTWLNKCIIWGDNWIRSIT